MTKTEVADRIRELCHHAGHQSDLEAELAWQIAHDPTIPLPAREYVFAPPRKWRADFCWLDAKIIVEVEGGIFSGGRHTRGAGFLLDVDKYNSAVLLGFRVFRFAGRQVDDGSAVRTIKQALGRDKDVTP